MKLPAQYDGKNMRRATGAASVESVDEVFGDEVLAGSLDCLRSAPLFAGVPDEVVRAADELFSLRHLGARQVAEQSARGPAIFVIRRGTFRLEHRIVSRATLTVAVLTRGHAFGLQSLFEPAPQLVAYATVPALLLQAPAASFALLCDRSLELWRNVARMLAGELAATAATLQSYRSLELARGLLGIFRRMAAEHGILVSGGILLDIAFSPADIAAIAGATEDNVVAALALLERQGLIRIDGCLIRLLDAEDHAGTSE